MATNQAETPASNPYATAPGAEDDQAAAQKHAATLLNQTPASYYDKPDAGNADDSESGVNN